jgi:hypothetical protein
MIGLRFRFFFTWAVACLAAGLAGCGGGDSSPPASQSAAVASERVTVSEAALTTRGGASGSDLPTVPGLTQREFVEPLKDVVEKVDPSKDEVNWESETFYEEHISKQYKALAKLFANPADWNAEKAAELAADDFQCGLLRPATNEVHRDSMFRVLRADVPKLDLEGLHQGRRGPSDGVRFDGPAGLAAAFEQLSQPYRDGQNRRLMFKTLRVFLEEKTAKTIAYFEANAVMPRGIVQQNAVWTCHWRRGATDKELPKLLSIEAEDFEEIVPGERGGVPFAECTEAVLGKNPSYNQQLARGDDHWHGQLDVAFAVHQGGYGVAMGDVNGDGLEDVYLGAPRGLPNRLYIQQPDGTAKEFTQEAGLDWLDVSRGMLFVDLDNDGDQDLAVTLGESFVLMENDGRGHFTRRVEIATPSRLTSMAAADYDNDGDLDLYVCGYSPVVMIGPGDVFANPVPYWDAKNGAPNFLVRNDGDWTFVDVTKDVGLNVNNTRFSLACAWDDFDNDGDQDLYVANDFGRKNLFRNDGGKFVDIAPDAGVEDIGAGMSAAWGDYNRDGRMDIYVANMFSSAGNRITFQRHYRPGDDTLTKQAIQRHVRGNTLFENSGDGKKFYDVSVEANVTMGRWAWASLFADFNNDGWEDIYVCNGFFTTEDTGDL